MTRALTGRITLNLLAGIVITVLTVMVTISWMAYKHNQQAAQGTQTMVDGGLKAMGKRLAQLANDYGWWEEAYDAYVREDEEWIDANVGTGITDTDIADLLVIVSPKGKVDHQWITDATADTVGEIVTHDALTAIRKVASGLPVENLAGVSSIYLDTPSVPMMIAIQHLAPVSRAGEVKNTDLPIIVFGQYLGKRRLHDLGRSFLIDNLEFARDVKAGRSRVSIHDIAGTTVGIVAWSPPTPGNALLRSALLPIGIALTLFCAAALATALSARTMAIALTKSEREAVTAARTDSMTNLVNRAGFTELLESETHAAACRDATLSVIYLDVNGFKTVNDTIGHSGGDVLVRALAVRLGRVLPANATLARIGGDEFAIALITGDIAAATASTAGTVARSLDQPFTISGFEFHITASVGYAIADGRGVAPGELVRRADIAMYQAKNGAEREAIAYHQTMETGALEKKQLESALRRAIDNGNELKVFYQPVVRASDLSIVGFEALARWDSLEFGSVSPAVFIPVAEETGLIHDIGRFIVDQACRDLVRWPGYRMAINVSPVQLRDPSFAADLGAMVHRHGLSPERFELELTEGILVNNPTIAKRKLALLKEHGFTLALDDFGTGFSSIGYLRQFPFDILKVDRSFVRDVGINASANALIQSLVSLGDALGLSVIAEGIENEDQLKLLRLIQCEFLQP
jgi:diguanylate cyclase (GGDEF)-like protein